MPSAMRIKTTFPILFIIAVFILFQAFEVKAQTTLTGTVLDERQSPLPSATVLLLDPSDSTLVKGNVTNNEGVYRIENLQSGKYLISVSMVGYQRKITDPIEVQEEPIQMDDIILVEAIEQMDEVAVTARRPMFEQESDRLVFNVQQHITSSGNSALKLLQKTPGVIVDRQNSSIGMVAKGDVLLMINDKIQRTPTQALMARLQGMRAENVERIEVIRQPPAKYDASGAASIIHIVLKENNRQGTNGTASITGGYGQREKAAFSLNLNTRHGKYNWYGDYTYNRNRSNNYEVNHFREYDYRGDTYYFQNYSTLRNYRIEQHTANLGLDIDLNDRTVVGFLLGGSTSDHVWGTDAKSRSANFVNDELIDETDFVFDQKTDMSMVTANANLLHKFGSAGQLNFDLDYAGIRFGNSGDLRKNRNSTESVAYDRSTPMEFWITSIDYENQLSSRWTMEAGVKGTFNDTRTSTTVRSLSDEVWPESDLFAGRETIDEQILAGYLSFDADISDKFSAEMGLRYEHYTYRLERENQEQIDNVISKPFPIARLNYDIDSANTLQLGYNRSITRPAFFHLASFLALIDPSLIVYANPQLRPTFTNKLSLSWQRNSAIVSLSYLDRTNEIYFYNTVDKEKHLQTSVPTNLDAENIIEASLSVPLYPSDWWEMNLNLSAFYHDLRDESNRPALFEKDIFTHTAQLNSTFQLGNNWSMGIDGMYMSRFLDGDQIKKDPPYFNLSIRKEFSARSSLTIAFQDIANSMGKRDWEYHQPAVGIRTFGDNDFSERQIRITYTLTFGNQDLSGRRERETGAEEVRDRM